MRAEIDPCDRCAELQGALESRATIGIALGLLMQQEQVDQDEALRLLKRASMTTNRKMRDIADELIARANEAAAAAKVQPPPITQERQVEKLRSLPT